MHGVQDDELNEAPQSSILNLFYIENYVALIFLLDQPFHASMLSAALYGWGFVNCLLFKDLYIAGFLIYKIQEQETDLWFKTAIFYCLETIRRNRGTIVLYSK